MRLIIIVFGILLIVTIIILLRKRGKSQLSEGCRTDSDCPNNELCIENPEENGEKQCFPSNRYFCNIQPFTELKKCLCPVDGDCNDSTDCDKCLNNPAFSCVKVTDKNPYTWIQNGKKIKIPNSPDGYGWCLPDIVNKNVECNPYTSEYILTEVGKGQYEWGCYCKYPNLFDHAQGPLSNCTLPRACGEATGLRPFGKLYVPSKEKVKCTENSDCGENGKCIDPLNPSPCGYDSKNKHVVVNDCKDSDMCVCHVPWEGEYAKDTDPLSGQCVCNDGLDYQCVVRSNDYFEMNCVKDFCTGVEGAHEADSNTCNSNQCYDPTNSGKCTCCKCPPGYIRCPDDITANNVGLVTYCEKAGPTCIKDPCSTKEVPGGYWSSEHNRCICPGSDTFISIPDENSAVGAICADACQGNGPCGNRGVCYLPEGASSHSDALCCDCECPYTNDGDNTCTCSGVLKGGSQAVKQANGADCCSDDDCCSGSCYNPSCHDICQTPQGSMPCPRYGTCRGDIEVNSSCKEKKCTIKPPSPPVTCPDSTLCPHGTTCCGTGGGKFNCCPYDKGVCCGDGLHCCPETHPVCDIKNKMCTSKDGKDKIPWTSPT